MPKEIDIAASAQNLIDRHARKTERLQGVLRGTARTHFAQGVRECLDMIQGAAVTVEGGKAEAPLAVSPTHAAVAK